ncbi:MAG: ricin-type beta-trefoil lectin domain protein [Lewinellaceae bacterium]|nr:ricin-type beta-trefoil lectin domain protein [Lewinellaceae bacterium]
MKTQKFNFKSLLVMSCIAVFFFGFYTPETSASTPVSLLKGQLPIPGSSQTTGILPTSLHGVLLENQKVKLTWEEDGNLTLRFYDREILWSSNTGGTGATLYFQESDGKLLIKDQNNKVVWSAGTIGGNKLWLQSNRNLVLVSSTDQTVWQSGTTINSLETDGWQWIGATGMPEDFQVPWNSGYNYLTIYTEGGDGGKKDVPGGVTAKGGSGATIIGTYEIGTGANQIPPGSFLRVFVGKKGRTRTGGTTSGCSGGAGTGVFMKRYNETAWRLLQVAGGGGGAFSYCCSGAEDGRSAETGRDGGKGGGNNGGAGGTNGMDGEEKLGAYPGSGVFDYNCMWTGGDRNPTILPGEPDNDYSTYDVFEWDSHYITFGLGPGGDGDIAGGGGGGYSGGGNGTGYHGGGGGGSYLNTEHMAITNIVMIKNDPTMGTEDGFILYNFSNSATYKPIKFAYNTNKCIDDNGSGTSNGNNIQSWDCNGSNAQKWFFHPTDRTIHSALDFNKCLDLSGGNTSNGANIQLWDCTSGNDNQHWVYNGLFKTIHSSVNSGKCFDATNGSASTNNVNLQLWECNYSSNNMKWVIDGATTVSNPANVKHIVPVLAPTSAVHSHTGAESGSNIQLWTKDNINTAEQWYFDGWAIKMRDHQNLCIDLSQSNTTNGNNIQLYNCNGTNAQKWLYDGMNRSIRSVVNPGKCMQIELNATMCTANGQI